MKINTQSQTNIRLEGYIHNNGLKTYPCETGLWWGEETCNKINIDDIIESQKLPDGKYKITVTIENMND